MPQHRNPFVSFAVLLAAAWLLLSGQLLAQYGAQAATTFHDSDDAVRLVELRTFLAGQGWFDLHQARLGFADGYVSRWSRLIDAGLAGLYGVFHLFAAAPFAEQLTMAIWPLLWLLPALAAVAAIAWRLAGRTAAIITLFLAIFCGLGVQQFLPGRIDHHNVQIALALLVVAATVWADRHRAMAIAAGALTGLALAIGFDALPFLFLCGAAFALRLILAGDADAAVRNYGIALAASALAAFLVSVPPAQWSVGLCDKIAINAAAALIVSGLGLALIAHVFARMHPALRAVLLLCVAVLAVCIFALLNPRCLAGPFAEVDPAVWPIWLDRVAETKSLPALFALAPATALATLAFPLLALFAVVVLALPARWQSAFGSCVAVASFLLAFGYMSAVMRGASYAVWLGLPFVAVLAERIFQRFCIRSLALRVVLLLLLTPTTLAVAAIMLASAAGQRQLPGPSADAAACASKAAYAPLAALPPGRVAVSEIEWGGYLLALTPHAVLAAPYHWIAPAILASHRIFARPPQEARRAVEAAGVRYLLICGAGAPTALTAQERADGLWAHLQRGDIPSWLERLPLPAGEPFKLFRVNS